MLAFQGEKIMKEINDLQTKVRNLYFFSLQF